MTMLFRDDVITNREPSNVLCDCLRLVCFLLFNSLSFVYIQTRLSDTHLEKCVKESFHISR